MANIGAWYRRVDYTKICADCVNYEPGEKYSTCTAPRDVVTGKELLVECRHARSMVGHCGPEGRHYVAATVVEDVKLERAGDAESKVTMLDTGRRRGRK